MKARLYANSQTEELTTGLEGGVFAPPTIPQGAGLQFYLKLIEEIDGEPTIDSRDLNSLSARIGWAGEAPTSGTYQLELTSGATTATTADIAYDAEAADIKSAIDSALAAASLTSLDPCTVTAYQDGFRIVFDDNTESVTFAVADNALWPASFVNVDEIEWDAGKAWVMDLRQTPVAETSTVATVVPSAPTITELQAGSTTDGTAINAIQKLAIPPNFAGGSFRIVRGGVKTDPIAVPVQGGADGIAAAIEGLADEDGEFVVTQVQDGVYIEFRGSMGGSAQSLMTVESFEDPEADWFFRLDTDTDEFRTLMRGADADTGEIDVPMDIVIEVDDGVTEGLYQKLYFRETMTFTRRVSDDSHNVSASLVWNQPRSKEDNLSHSSDSLLLGNRAVAKEIGDGVSTSFVINHNLVSNSQSFTVDAGTDVFTAASHNLQDDDPVNVSSTTTLPDPLADSTTYWVINATDDTFQLATSAGGSAVDLTDTGSGTHTVTLRDGTFQHVMVEVWETGGSEARVSPEDYTVERTSANAVTVSGFASTPSSGEYIVLLQTFGRPATYQDHDHTLDEVPEAKARIEALEARVTALEAKAGTGNLSTADVEYGDIIAQDVMKKFIEVYPSRASAEYPDTGDLTLLDTDQFPRAGGLLPAVHDTTEENLSGVLTAANKLPRAADTYTDRVFENDTALNITVPGARGRRSATVKPGEYVACSGAVADGGGWYRVSRFEAGHAGVTFTADADDDAITLGTADDLKVGDVVQLTTTDTLPAGLSTGTDYWILEDFQLATSATGSAVDITDTGTGTHTATRQAESTWYPVDFDRTLFVKHLNARMFPRRSQFRMDFALELALLGEPNTDAQWVVVIEEGSYPEDSATTPTGANLGDPVWNTANPVLEQRLIIGEDMSTHTFGLKVTHTVEDNASVYAAYAIYYGQSTGTRAPTSSNVSYRARLVRFDTEDSVASPEGLVAVAGMAPGTATFADVSDQLGLATVSK